MPFNVICQNEIDSLNHLLDNKKLTDSSRVKTLLAFYFTDLYYSDQEKVLQHTYDALSLSKSINYTKGIAQSMITLGGIYRLRTENDSAFKYYQRAIEQSLPSNDKANLIDAYMGLGNTYNQISDWERAIEQFQKVEELAIVTKDSITIGSVNNNIGNTYLNQAMLQKALEHYQISLRMGDDGIQKVSLINIAITYASLDQLEKARDYYQKAIEKQGDNGNPHHLAFIYKNLGIVEKKSGNFKEALAKFNEALAINQNLSNDYQISDLYYSIGNLYFDQNRFEDALIEYQKSLEIREQIQHQIGECFSLIAMGMTYQKLNQNSKAIQLLLKADKLAGVINMMTAKNDISQTLSNIYASAGDYKKAYEYQVAFMQFSDSLKTIRNEEKIAELEEKYQNEQKQQEIDLLSAENEIANLQIQKQQNLRNYLIIIAVVLILFIGLVYNRYQIKVKANSRLRELDQLKSTFFTNISHEFRTPLTLIISPLQKLLSQEKEKKVINELGLIHRNAIHLLSLTNQLLDLSKLEAGKLSLNVSKGNFIEFVKIILASFESLAVDKNITFEYDLKDAPTTAYYDEDKLLKVINNLLSNAFKFTPVAGRVKLKAEAREHTVYVSVSDTGPGLDAEEREEVFKRFHQNMKMASHAPGTGVGLTLSKELMTLHYGAIKVDSQNGEGSTFTISFPLNKSGYRQADLSEEIIEESTVVDYNETEAKEYEVSAAKEGPLVLIVEDNTDLRNHINSILEENYTVLQATDGKDGIAKALEAIPDLIISDLMMPEVDGIELCNQLKENEKTSHIPIVLLTAKADKETKLEGLTRGADDYLTKPFEHDELKVRIKNLIDQRAKLRARFGDTITIAPSGISIQSPDDIFIKKAIKIVDEHISDSEFTVEAFQKEIGMSRMQLHRKLKAMTNYSASEFIRELRLQRASDLLSTKGMTITEAAFASGFSSLSYFTKIFKEKYKSTPSQYQINSLKAS